MSATAAIRIRALNLVGVHGCDRSATLPNGNSRSPDSGHRITSRNRLARSPLTWENKPHSKCVSEFGKTRLTSKKRGAATRGKSFHAASD